MEKTTQLSNILEHECVLQYIYMAGSINMIILIEKCMAAKSRKFSAMHNFTCVCSSLFGFATNRTQVISEHFSQR